MKMTAATDGSNGLRDWCSMDPHPDEENNAWVMAHRYGHYAILMKHVVSHDGARLTPASPLDVANSHLRLVPFQTTC